MRHPSEGVLRRLVDEPAGVTDADRAHVAGCPTCLARAGRPSAPTRSWSTPRSRRPAPPASTRTPPGPGSRRRRAAPRDERSGTAGARSGRGRWRTAVRRPVVAALSAVVLAGRGRRGGGQRLAADLPDRAASTPVEVTADRPGRSCPTCPPTATSRSRRQPDTAAGAPTPRPRASATGLAVPEVAELPAGRDRRPDLPGGRQP